MSNSHQTSHTGSDGSAEGPQSGTSSPAMPSSGESSAYQFLELPFLQRFTQASLSQDN